MANPVDAHIGQRIRRRRWMAGLNQQQLGNKVGITFQQIQKYETGANRISVSRLWDIASALDVPVSFFFEGLEAGIAPPSTSQDRVLMGKEALNLVRAYYTLPEMQRRWLFDFARALSDAA